MYISCMRAFRIPSSVTGYLIYKPKKDSQNLAVNFTTLMKQVQVLLSSRQLQRFCSLETLWLHPEYS
jgi:hypothetical protein